MGLPTIYLAGAIRDHREEDIEWREEVIKAVGDYSEILNPLGGKTFNKSTGEWLFHGINPVGSLIVPHDFWCVDRADIILFNFLSLAEGYPSIGTLCEFGRSTARNCLRYTIIPNEYTGHRNGDKFHLHPFIAQNSAIVFNTVEDSIVFLSAALGGLSGFEPTFAGYVND